MSYAHEIFGVKGTRYDIWTQDLLLAGTASATFNSDRMREIAASPFVKDDGFAGYYLLLWCKYNNIPLNEIMRVGQKVAITNNDYGTVDYYILVTVNSSMLHFVSANFVGFMPTLVPGSTYYDGDPDHSLIGMWYKSESPNWCGSVTTGLTGVNALVANYAYGHGVPEELKDILKQNVSQPKHFYPVINDTPYFLYNDWYPLGVRNTFGNTAIHLSKMHNTPMGSNVRLGAPCWSVVLPAGSTEHNTYPQLGPTWLETPHSVATITEINSLTIRNLSDNVTYTTTIDNVPNMTVYNTPHLARFTVEI